MRRSSHFAMILLAAGWCAAAWAQPATPAQGGARADAVAKLDVSGKRTFNPNGWPYPEKHNRAQIEALSADLVSVFEHWLEESRAPPDAIPETLMQTTAPYAVLAARPLCRWPNYRHHESGDPKALGSYRCAAPEHAAFSESALSGWA
jgi:hypothetical protein